MQAPEVMNSMGSVETAAELRRQLHTMKARDREAVNAATVGTSGEKFLKSHWFSALVTGAATFLLLYVTNPLFVQENDKEKVHPNLKKVASWAILAALIVALGPMLYEKFLINK